MTALFVRDQVESQWVNLARATAIRVKPDDRRDGEWIVLAYSSGRVVCVGRDNTEEGAEYLAARLVARANAGGA